ncbi:MAG: cyclic nucleotide-binding domain-containing protein [Verrucomicrobiales bacterium]|nr:cyclic nucleotide-binding domain-containing protein [Verrucomicrobiales bacterium]
MNDINQFDKDSFFYLLDEDEKKLVLARMQSSNFALGESIFKEGDNDEKLYFVEKGSVSLIKTIGSDMNKTILIAPEGKIFGEFSFIDGGVRSATALASDTTELLSLDRKDFDILNKESPEIGAKIYNNLLLTLTRRIRKTSEAHWGTIEKVINNQDWINPDVA